MKLEARALLHVLVRQAVGGLSLLVAGLCLLRHFLPLGMSHMPFLVSHTAG